MPTPALSPELAQEAFDAFTRLGSKTEAAKSLGLNTATFTSRLKKYYEYQAVDPAVKDAAAEMGIADLGIIKGGWLKTKDASLRFTMPSATDDPQGIVDALKEGLSDVTPAPYTNPPTGPDSLCAVFPVADLHVGLLTDQEEVGHDWDTKKAGAVFRETFGRLVSVTPSAGTAILAQLGDLTHNDDQRNITPQSGHQLDVDSRYFMILRRSVAVMKWAIDSLREKYPRVIYRGCRGNHDITTHYAVTLALSEHYRDTPSVEIIDSANEFYVHEFGNNMLLLHHGDKAKPDRLVQFAAAEWPEMWGRTRHRLALSGHVHHESRKEIGGMTFESVGTIIPRDAHAYTHGYSAKRSLVSISLDKEQGEISRARVAA